MAINSPSDISDLAGWWDISATDLPSTNGANVTSWDDQSSLNRNFTTTSGKEPIWNSTENAVHISQSGGNTSVYTTTGSATNYSEWTLVYAVKAVNDGYSGVFAAEFNGFDPETSLLSSSAGAIRCSHNASAWDCTTEVSTSEYDLWYIIGSASGNTISFYKNNVLVNTVNGASISGTVVSTTDNGFIIGNNNNGQEAYWRACCIYKHKLTSTERADLFQYAQANGWIESANQTISPSTISTTTVHSNLSLNSDFTGPTSISNCTAFYDRNDLSGTADGANIASWSDKSGTGRTITEGSSLVQPSWVASEGAVFFNPSDALTGTVDAGTFTTHSWCFSIKRGDTANNSGTEGMFTVEGGSGAASEMNLGTETANADNLQWRHGSGTYTVSNQDASATVYDFWIFIYDDAANECRWYKNGTLADTVAVGSFSTMHDSTFRMGSGAGGSRDGTFYTRGVILYHKELTSQEISDLSSWAANNWGTPTGQTITPTHIASVASVASPTLDTSVTVSAGFTASTTSVPQPSVLSVTVISASHITSTTSVAQPTVVAEDAIVEPSFFSSTSVASPSVASFQRLYADHFWTSGGVEQPSLPTASTSTYRPDASTVVSQDQGTLTGDYTAVDDDPDSPDGSWIVGGVSGNNHNSYTIDFSTDATDVSGDLDQSAGSQEIKLWCRKAGGANTPTVDLQLVRTDNSTVLASTGATNVTNTTGQMVTLTFAGSAVPSGLSLGSDVEIRCVVAANNTGGPSGRSTVDLGAVEWNASLSGGGGGPIAIGPRPANTSATVFIPALALGEEQPFVAPSHIAATTTVYGPTLEATVELTPSLIPSASSVAEPSLTTLVTLSPSHIASTATVAEPVLEASYEITASHIASTAVVQSANLALDISAQHIASAAQVFGPTLVQEQELGPSFIASTATVAEPTVIFEQFVTPSVVDASPSFGTASLALEVTAPHIASTVSFGTALVEPGEVTLAPSVINQTVVNNPLVAGEATSVQPSHIASTATVYTGAALSLGISAIHADSTTAVQTPRLTISVTPSVFSSGSVFGPSVIGAEIFADDIDPATYVYLPTISHAASPYIETYGPCPTAKIFFPEVAHVSAGGSATWRPDAIQIVSQTTGTLSGTAADIDDDPDSPDGAWIVGGNSGNTYNDYTLDVSLASTETSGNLATGAGSQEIKVWARLSSGSGVAPTVDVQLVRADNATVLASTGATNITNTTGQMITLTFDGSAVPSGLNLGSDVEVRCVVVASNSGAPNTRGTADIGAVEWNATIAGGGSADDSQFLQSLCLQTTTAVFRPTLQASATAYQNIFVDGFYSTSTVGQPELGEAVVEQTVSPSLIVAATTVPTGTSLSAFTTLAPTIISSTTAFGTATLDLAIVAPLVAPETNVGEPTVQPGTVSLAPSIISSTLTLGTSKLDLSVEAIHISATNVFSPSVLAEQTVAPSALGPTSSVGSPGLGTLLVPSLFTSGQLFEPVVTPGEVSVAPSLVASALQVHEPTVATEAVTLLPTTISATALFAPAVTATYDVTAPALASTTQVYGPTLDLSVSVSHFSTTSFGTPTLLPRIDAQFFTSGQLFAPSVVPGEVSILATHIATTTTVATPSLATIATVAPGIFTTGQLFAPSLTTLVEVAPSVVSASSVVTEPSVAAGTVTIAPSLIGPTTSFANPSVSAGGVGVVATLFTTGQVAEPVLSVGEVSVAPSVITSTTSVANPSVSAGGVAVVTSLFTSGQVAEPLVEPGAVAVSPSVITATTTLGEPSLSLALLPVHITSTLAVQEPSLAAGEVTIAPSVVSATEIFTPNINAGGVQIQPDRIESTASFGTLALGLSINPVASAAATQVFGASITSLVEPTIISATTVGQPRLDLAVTAPSLASTTQVFGPSLTLTIAPSVVASTASAGTPTLDLHIEAALLSATTLGVPIISTGAIIVTPARIQSTASFGTALLTSIIAAQLIAATTTVNGPTLDLNIVCPHVGDTVLPRPVLSLHVPIKHPLLAGVTTLSALQSVTAGSATASVSSGSTTQSQTSKSTTQSVTASSTGASIINVE